MMEFFTGEDGKEYCEALAATDFIVKNCGAKRSAVYQAMFTYGKIVDGRRIVEKSKFQRYYDKKRSEKIAPVARVDSDIRFSASLLSPVALRIIRNTAISKNKTISDVVLRIVELHIEDSISKTEVDF